MSGQSWLLLKALLLVGTGVALILLSSAVFGAVLIVVGVVAYVALRGQVRRTSAQRARTCRSGAPVHLAMRCADKPL
jgi:hypothetical protein